MSIIWPLLSVTGITLALFGFFVLLELLSQHSLADRRRQILRNGFFVLLGLAALHFHVNVLDGVIVDQGGAAVAVATLFGGYGTGFATAGAEIAYRLAIGGDAALAGSLGIAGDFLGAALVAWLAHRKRPVGHVRFRTILWAGVAVGAAEAFSLLLISPYALGLSLFASIGPTLFATQWVTATLFGSLLRLQDERLQTQRELAQKASALRLALRQTVEILSSATMLRDPMTAGHQRRVADLAVAMAAELGLSEARQEGIYLACLVHDIGHIQIPMEILMRPRQLSPEEFELIKVHAETGYEILKDLDLPWPIADIVLQHHENLDGSGYPRGLRGDQTLLEAKILRVSDSLEAMLSHRPFRRACTVEHALAELQSKQGTQFDPLLVEVCVKLFRDKGYAFPDTKGIATA